MKICGLQKLTLLDFPGKTACTVFTGGCNLRCPFCHNASLVLGGADSVETEEFFAFLGKRKGLLQGVCISGGEPLLQQDIVPFIQRVRDLGYAVKLDTNGTQPQKLGELLAAQLVDYVAMDLKNAPSLYGKTVGVNGFDFEPVAQNMALLREANTPYEYRTTVVKGLHTVETLTELASLINGQEHWYLQQFIDSGLLINGTDLAAYSAEEMAHFANALRPLVPNLALRGV